MKIASRYRLWWTVVLLTLSFNLPGCATFSTSTQDEVPARHSISEFRDQRFAEVTDPWEGFNRSMYKFNFYFDKYLFLPVVNGYEFVTPVFVQDRISNIYNNLGEVKNLTNSMFQLKGTESVTTLGRFVTNSTVGLGGLFDPATSFGMERHEQDFGKTLGYWGTGSGPYLVLPIFGPSSLRDTGGLAVDTGIYYGLYTAIDPFGSTGNSFAIGAGISTLEAIDARHQQSFRYHESGYPFEYYMVRFFYHQKREIETGKPLSAELQP
jgi:phospholipid-binding lipoprotein MlaA